MGSSQDLTRVLYSYAMFIFLTSVSSFIYAGFEPKAKTAVSAEVQSHQALHAFSPPVCQSVPFVPFFHDPRATFPSALS